MGQASEYLQNKQEIARMKAREEIEQNEKQLREGFKAALREMQNEIAREFYEAKNAPPGPDLRDQIKGGFAGYVEPGEE